MLTDRLPLYCPECGGAIADSGGVADWIRKRLLVCPYCDAVALNCDRDTLVEAAEQSKIELAEISDLV
jgi:hypothetical protein